MPGSADHEADHEKVRQFLARASIELTESQVGLLVQYLDVLEHWNHKINLVSCRNRAELLERHVLDSLTLLPHLRAGTVVDAGSGAGLPGMPLAIACPDIQFHLVDSNAKKTGFLYSASAGLGLSNVMIHNTRLHALPPGVRPDCLVSRAFGPVTDLLKESNAVLPPGALLLLMKGRNYEAELSAIQAPFEVVAVHDLSPADAPGRSMLMELRKMDESA